MVYVRGTAPRSYQFSDLFDIAEINVSHSLQFLPPHLNPRGRGKSMCGAMRRSDAGLARGSRMASRAYTRHHFTSKVPLFLATETGFRILGCFSIFCVWA
jgi:hypothetical protein